MAKSPGAEFERDLEAIFEDRAQDFSSELRQLLEKLWLEGVQEGRALERQDQFERAPPSPGAPARIPYAWHGDRANEFTVLKARGPQTLTLEDVERALKELNALEKVRQLERQVLLEPELQLERRHLMFSRPPLFEEGELAYSNSWQMMPLQHKSGSSVPTREIMGTWSGSSDECRLPSPTTSSTSSPRSSTLDDFMSSARSSTGRGKSGKG